MQRLTADDIQKIAQILKVEAGIEIKVMPNRMMKKGISVLMMHPEDVDAFKKVFSPNKNIGPYP